jgi:hypothetical protein
MRWEGHVASIEKRNANRILVGNPVGKRPFGRLWCRWENIIRVGLMEIWWEVVDSMHLAQDRDQWWALMNTVMNLQVPKQERNFLTS